MTARSKPPAAFIADDHDHARCRAAIVAGAEDRCARRGVRLTTQRRRVLEIVADSHSAIGAYEIMDRLTADGEGGMAKRPAPITVYRALDFLMEHGLVHRLASLNAYVACARGSIEEHKSQFLVCRQCGVIAELIDPAIEQAIAGAASGVGFQVATPVVEVAGVCPNCRPATAVRE